MIFGQKTICLVLVLSAAEDNNDNNADKALNNKTGQHSPAFHHLPIQALPLDAAESDIHNSLFSQD